MRCASLASSPVLTEITTSSSCSTTPSFRRASAQFSARTCHASILPTSSALKYGPVEGQPCEQFHSSFLQNNTGSSFKINLIPAKKPVGMLIQAHRVKFKATRTVTIPFKEGALPANEYLKETERIVKVTFPDSSRIEYIGDKTWRSRLRPITFINVTATPSVEMRSALSIHLCFWIIKAIPLGIDITHVEFIFRKFASRFLNKPASLPLWAICFSLKVKNRAMYVESCLLREFTSAPFLLERLQFVDPLGFFPHRRLELSMLSMHRLVAVNVETFFCIPLAFTCTASSFSLQFFYYSLFSRIYYT